MLKQLITVETVHEKIWDKKIVGMHEINFEYGNGGATHKLGVEKKRKEFA